MADTYLDPEAWQMLKSMTDPAFLAELIGIFLKDSPEMIEQMRAGIEAGDVELVRRAAHSLKSNAASFGATRLAEASRELERLARSGTLGSGTPGVGAPGGGGRRMLAEIEDAYAQLAPLLAEVIR